MGSSTTPADVARPLRWLALPALGALLAVLVVSCGGSERSAAEPRSDRVPARKAAKLPNIVFIYTDDQQLSTFKRRYMPKTFRLLVKRGTQFSDYVVSTPLCCPSRATYVTGAYPHNDGVFSNRGGYRNLRGKYDTLQSWMHNGGYRTAWIGKYLQGYPNVNDPNEAPPGIDDWHATFRPNYGPFRVYGEDRTTVYGRGPSDYYTRVITGIANREIRQQSKRRRPLFLTVNNLAPHIGRGGRGRCRDVIPSPPGHVKDPPKAKLPTTRAYDEADISDKPRLAGTRRLSEEKGRQFKLQYKCAVASLRGVDDGVASIHRTLKRTGELRNTVIFFSSDNGLLRGEHRLGGKNKPYEEGIHQPLAVLAGRQALGGRRARSSDRLVSNVDFAPTILDLAGAKPCLRPGACRKLDGRSLVPLLEGRKGRFPTDREILVEGGTGGGDCLYAGIRTPDVSYVEYARERSDGTCRRRWQTEMYDLSGRISGEPDRLQLENLTSPTIPASSKRAVIAERTRLSRRLDELRSCSGPDCR